MKSIAAAATIATIAIATSSLADGLSDPVVEPVVIRDAAAQSSAPTATTVLALTTLLVFGTALGQ